MFVGLKKPLTAGEHITATLVFEKAMFANHLATIVIPLVLLFNEVVADPKVVGEWTYPGTGAGRSTHFHLLKAAK